MNRSRLVALMLLAPLPATVAAQRPSPASPPQDELPRFTADGRLERPTGWEAWVMVGTSTGLSYSEEVNRQPGAGPGMFHNVYLQPWAYRHFVDTGKFPEGSMFVLSFYEPSTEAAPARAGHYPKDPLPMFEVHVKRAGVDSTGWGFYNFGPGTERATKIPGSAACYSCHAKEARVDHVFVQFYPALRRFVRQ